VKASPSFFKVLQQPKMAALLLLGFSSGLPLYLTGKDPLQAWLSNEGVSLPVIAAFSVVAVPYSLKFLWSPILDRYVPPFLGRRRGWLAITQIGLVLAIALMAFQDHTNLKELSVSTVQICKTAGGFQGLCEFWETLKVLSISPLFWAAMSVAFLSASQDIVVDAYRTDALDETERGAGASLFLLGYRVAILIAGALTFYLARFMSWPMVYLIMAGLMIVGLVTSIFAPEPKVNTQIPKTLRESVVLPFQEFFQRSGVMKALLVLGFIVIYKLGDSLLKNVATPFLLDKGLNLTTNDLAFPKALGIVAVIVGTLAGGAIMTKIGVNRSLWLFGGIQAVGNLSYVALAAYGKAHPLPPLAKEMGSYCSGAFPNAAATCNGMLAAINIESFCAGLESAAFVAFLMSLCNQGFSATQYALFSSLQAFSRDIIVAPSGSWAGSLGWPLFFFVTAVLALVGMVLLPFFAPWNPQNDPTMSRPGLD
jgi:MFS transporter, PAT family, beta-lactamase induction signal transducer AmpG